MTLRNIALSAVLSSLPVALHASDAILGDATQFTSPNGVVERCVRIQPIPDGSYSKSDAEEEEFYCSIGCCQTNANQSPQGQWHCPLCRAETAPLRKSSGTVEFKIGS